MASTTALRTGPECSGIPEVPSGSNSPHKSPSLDISLASTMESSYPVDDSLEQKGEAAHTIPGECERLFCDALSAIFLGERLSRQESLGVDASLTQMNNAGGENPRIETWVEVLDYTSDAIYRGFVTDMTGERTLFVFLAETAAGHGLKSGLIALFELASVSVFGCSQIVACVPRSKNGSELESVRNLGWCGFGLTTLEQFGAKNANFLSNRWLFLSAEV
ncbi:ornithine decarboxylase antizyme-domain-containing protein [Aspergillus recurvatus]